MQGLKRCGRISFSPLQPRESLQAGDTVRDGDDIGQTQVEMSLRLRAAGQLAESEMRPSGKLAMLHPSREIQKCSCFLLHLTAEIYARCFFELFDQNTQRSVASICCGAQLAVFNCEIREPCVPCPGLGESSELEAQIGKLLKGVPLEWIRTLRAESVLCAAEKRIGALHVATLKAELLRTKNGHPDRPIRVFDLLRESVDPFDFGTSLIEAS